jgi:hypothetical protein
VLGVRSSRVFSRCCGVLFIFSGAMRLAMRSTDIRGFVKKSIRLPSAWEARHRQRNGGRNGCRNRQRNGLRPFLNRTIPELHIPTLSIVFHITFILSIQAYRRIFSRDEDMEFKKCILVLSEVLANSRKL